MSAPASSSSPICSKCSKTAALRCAQCHSEWYCSKQCQRAHWKTHNVRCGVQSEPIHIRVDFVPPKCYQDANQEQHFTLVINDPVKDVHEFRPNPRMQYIASQISLNNIRMAQITNPFDLGRSVMPPSTPASMDAASKFGTKKVPVMFHYEPAELKLTTTNSQGQQLWQKILPYQLDPACFPQNGVSPHWSSMKEAPDDVKQCTLTHDQIAAEEFEFVDEGRPECVSMISSDQSIMVQFEVQKCLAKGTSNAMSFYIDRVWSPRTIAIIAKPELFGFSKKLKVV